MAGAVWAGALAVLALALGLGLQGCGVVRIKKTESQDFDHKQQQQMPLQGGTPERDKFVDAHRRHHDGHVQVQQHRHEEHVVEGRHGKAKKDDRAAERNKAKKEASLSDWTLETLPRSSQGPDCQGFSFEASYGTVEVKSSRLMEFPTVKCPVDHVFDGPRIQCSWVDRICEVQAEGDSAAPDLCHMQFNFTLPGQGLKRWPIGVPPRRISRRSALQTIVWQNERNASALPAAVSPEKLVCRKEAYVDLDFEHAKIARTNPPYTEEFPWSKTYMNLAHLGDMRVDLKVTRVGSPAAPGDTWNDGNSSATGRINIDQESPSELRFQFMESGTQRPIIMTKVFFTVFDLDDARDGTSNKEVVGSVAEYFVSRRTCLKVKVLSGGKCRFYGDGVSSRDDDIDSVEDIWLSSLQRTVVFVFRDMSEFSLVVQATPEPSGQILEFAGWSELVDIGTKASPKKLAEEKIAAELMDDLPPGMTAAASDRVAGESDRVAGVGHLGHAVASSVPSAGIAPDGEGLDDAYGQEEPTSEPFAEEPGAQAAAAGPSVAAGTAADLESRGPPALARVPADRDANPEATAAITGGLPRRLATSEFLA